MQKKYPMTKAGKDKLEKDLTYLKEKKRKELDEQIKKARRFCDVAEDVSFAAMVNERTSLDDRIKSLEDMLYHAELIQPGDDSSSLITLGKSVTFKEIPDGEEETYTIVGVTEADPAAAKISNESPIAKSLIGHKENDEVYIQTPDGKIKVKVVQVH